MIQCCGGCRQAVTALVCGSSIRGFKSRHSPLFFRYLKNLGVYFKNASKLENLLYNVGVPIKFILFLLFIKYYFT